MRNFVISVICLSSGLLAYDGAIAGSPSQTDRVLAGLDNLASLPKSVYVSDEGLKQILMNPTLNCVIICQRMAPPQGKEPASVEYHVLYVTSRRTRFDKHPINKQDYDALVKFANKVNRD